MLLPILNYFAYCSYNHIAYINDQYKYIIIGLYTSETLIVYYISIWYIKYIKYRFQLYVHSLVKSI